MASRLNVSQETFGQLVRFALVGFFLAGVYSAIYWYLATYVMPPVAAVVIAFLVAVSIGFVLHSRWSFRGHGKCEDHRMKVKFLTVQSSGFLLNEVFTWVLTGPMHGPTWWPLVPAIFLTPLATYCSTANGCSADGTPRLSGNGRARPAALVVSRAPEVLADLIRREVAAGRPDAQILEIGCGTGHNLEMLGHSARSTRSSSTMNRA